MSTTGHQLHQQLQPKLRWDLTKWRIDRFLSQDEFSSVNIRSALELRRTSDSKYIELAVYSVPGLERPKFKEIVDKPFTPCEVGLNIGPSWSTHWFRVSLKIPKDWPKDIETSFAFNPECEGMFWSEKGSPLQGLTGGYGGDKHVEYIIPKGQHSLNLYIEVACNGMFGNGNGGDINPPNPDRTFNLVRAELIQHNSEAYALIYDLQILRDTASQLGEEHPVGCQALAVANEIVNVFEKGDKSSILKARKLAWDKFFGKGGASQAHKIIAVGHCHIDTAWLWPYDETRRKTARSWSRQLLLMDRYPDYTFVCSQAQQFKWVEEDYPDLFARIKQKVKAGQFLPLGSTWVEMDCNLPSGESFCRQFLFGQRYYQSRFGKKSEIFWLPDTFGYSAQLPQIIKQSGAKYFFTQKLSWNNINKFPNTTFYWEGLDGTRVLTHMAPGETYTAQATIEDVVKSVKNNRDKFYTHSSLLVYGNGDGGGGPLAPMIERLQRLKNVDGLPPVKMGTVEQFYHNLESDIGKSMLELVTWSGELYFELHRGTYTSHGAIKRGNRRSEALLREVELISLVTWMKQLLQEKQTFTYPREKINKLWELVLLNQFHDVLPGSSIGMVYKDAQSYYERVEKECKEILKRCYEEYKFDSRNIYVFNSLGWKRSGVVKIPKSCCSVEHLQTAQVLDQENVLAYVHEASSMGFSVVGKLEEKQEGVTAYAREDGFILENSHLKARFNSGGLLTSLFDKDAKREVILNGSYGNMLVMYEDQPIFWDAWDVEIYHMQKGKLVPPGDAKIAAQGPLFASLQVEYKLSGTSTCRQIISLSAKSRILEFDCEVDWNENHMLLKAEFAVDVHNEFATYETQYGYIRRPTHYNTSWDAARFEVCGHRWADLSEWGYGVALLNDCKYGYSTTKNLMKLSLLRSPKAPDNTCDIGVHRFRYGILPHVGTLMESDVVRQGFEFNTPLEIIASPKSNPGQIGGLETLASFFHIPKATNVFLDAVKLSEDNDRAVIIRLYEGYGGRATTTMFTRLPIVKAYISNILEEDLHDVTSNLVYEVTNGGNDLVASLESLKFSPFQVITLKLVL